MSYTDATGGRASTNPFNSTKEIFDNTVGSVNSTPNSLAKHLFCCTFLTQMESLSYVSPLVLLDPALLSVLTRYYASFRPSFSLSSPSRLFSSLVIVDITCMKSFKNYVLNNGDIFINFFSFILVTIFKIDH